MNKDNPTQKGATPPLTPAQQGFQMPPGAVPLCMIFVVKEGANDKIGIIINENADPNQVKFALDNAIKIANDRQQGKGPATSSDTPGQPQRHPTLTELLME